MDDNPADLAGHPGDDETRFRSGEGMGSDFRTQVDERLHEIEHTVRGFRRTQRREIRLLGAATVVLLIFAAASVGVLIAGRQQFRRTLVNRLASLDRRSEVDRDPPVFEAVRISGLVYLGQRDHPAAGAKIHVYQQFARDTPRAVRLIRADQAGQFQTGDLPLGRYLLLVPLCDRQGRENKTGHMIQSRPFGFYHAGGTERVELDVLAKSTIKISVTGRVRDTLRINGRDRRLYLMTYAYLEGHDLPVWTEYLKPKDMTWPVVGNYGTHYAAGDQEFEHRPSHYPVTYAVPPGSYRIRFRLSHQPSPHAVSVAEAEVKLEIHEGDVGELTLETPRNIDDLRITEGEWTPLPLQVEWRSRAEGGASSTSTGSADRSPRRRSSHSMEPNGQREDS